MAANPNNEKLIAQYLLGELPEEQQVEIEERAFADKDYLASITAVENDLIDEYVRHELSEKERQQFEKRFLASAGRRKRVEFARALANVPAEAPAAEKESRMVAHSAASWRVSLEAFVRGLNPVARFAMGTAMLLLLVGGAWLLTETLRLRSQLTRLQAENQSRQDERRRLERQVELERHRSEELAANLNQEKQQREQSEESLRQLSETGNATNPSPPVIASLTLLPGLSRGGGDKPALRLPENARLVQLQVGIDPEEQYQSFVVDLRTVAGRRVWTKENLIARNRRSARVITLTVPANALKPDQYELRLSGIASGGGREDVGFYYFDVSKK
jgi:hypothetical protein